MKTRTLALPQHYRLQDVLAFHRRDSESVAEQVGQQSLRKGLLIGGAPAVLTLDFNAASTPSTVRYALELDDQPAGISAVQQEAQLQQVLKSVLGLHLDPQPFCDFAADDPLLGPLTRAQPGLRVVQSATLFEALTWAIIGQQINLSFAIALRRTLIQQAGRQHSSGLWCYPDAAAVAALDSATLTRRKFSRAKADTVLRLAGLVADGSLQLELSASNSVEQIAQALLAVKGIGPWTVNYGLLRGYGYADCSLHGDVAVRAALQHLLGEDSKPDMARTEQFLARYRPHRTMAAAHLWASLHPRQPD